MFKLGQYLIGKGGIPVGGSDNNKLWQVFTAGDRPVLIMCGHYWSGDASEYYTLNQIPPGFALNGTLGMTDIPGAIEFFTGNIEGAVGTVASPESLFGHYTRTPVGAWFILPPNYSIAVQPVTAASAADFGVRIGGFEIDA